MDNGSGPDDGEEDGKVTISSYESEWHRLNHMKSPGDSFADVLKNLLDDYERLQEQVEQQRSKIERLEDELDGGNGVEAEG